MSSTVRSTVAALVLTVPVLAEVARPDLFDATWGHLLFAVSQLLGWALVCAVVLASPDRARDASPRGRRVVLAACALQVGFAVVYGATAWDGQPLEASFVLFLLGFAALLVGGLLWGSRLRRVASARLAATGLVGVAVLGALAMLVASDPFHDVLLISSYLAWVAVGRGLDLVERAPAGPSPAPASVPTAPATA